MPARARQTVRLGSSKLGFAKGYLAERSPYHHSLADVAVTSISGDQASVTMRLCTGLPRAKFALLARPRTKSWTTDTLYLFEKRLLGLHSCDDAATRRGKTGH